MEGKNLKNCLLAVGALLAAMSVFFWLHNRSSSSAGAADKTEHATAIDKSAPDLYYFHHPYLARAHELNEHRKYDSAINSYKEAATKFEVAKQWKAYVWVNSYIGRLYLFVSGKNYEDARPFLENAIRAGREHLSAEDPNLAISFYYLGLYYYNAKMSDSAAMALMKALKTLVSNYGEVNIYASDIHEAIGNVYLELNFDNINAEAEYLKSIHIKETLHEKKTDSVFTNSYYNLVKFYRQNGDFEMAQTYCYKAIEYLPYVKNHQEVWEELLEGMLADIYQEQGLYQKAIPHLYRAVQINIKSKEGDKGYLSFYYHSLGELYRRSSAYDSAVTYFRRSLYLTKFSSEYEDQQERSAIANFSLGGTFEALGNFREALLCFKASLRTRRSISGLRNVETAAAFQAIARIYMEMGSFDSATAYYQQAVQAAAFSFQQTDILISPALSDLRINQITIEIVAGKAALLNNLYKQKGMQKLLLSAWACYQLADSLIGVSGYTYERESTQLAFNRINKQLYAAAIDCAWALFRIEADKKYVDFAFRCMAKTKSLLLASAINQEDLLKSSNVSMADQRQYFQLQHEKTFLRSRLEEASSDSTVDDHTMQVLHQRIYSNEQRMKKLDENFAGFHPFYASSKNVVDSFHLEQLQFFSQQSKAVILEYFWANDEVFVLGVYKQRYTLVRVQQDSSFRAHLSNFRNALERGYVANTSAIDFASFTRSAFYLYSALVSPLLKELEPAPGAGADLLIIPDGPLLSIPFEAFITADAANEVADYRKLNYLVRDFVVGYNYSSGLLLKAQSQPEFQSKGLVLAFGYSADSSDDDKPGRKAPLADLPGSANELKSVGQYFEGKFYLGKAATEERFKKEAPDFDILHLAVHGRADSSNLYGSHLIFHNGADRVNDQNLYAYEIYDIPLRAGLVVLSACESGIGKFEPGEGMFSMARGFFHSGTSSVVMSLWKVNDILTANIMDYFYKHLAGGKGVNRSMQLAKIEYLSAADRRTAHPAYWAAFAALGRSDTRVMPIAHFAAHKYWLIAGVIAIAALMAGFGLISLRRVLGKRH